MKLLPVLLLASACSAVLLNAGCSSSDDSPAATGAVGGPVQGAEDAHCADRHVVGADPGACHADASEEEGGASGEGEGGASGEGEASDGTAGSDCNQTHAAEYGDTLPNSEGDDDDCKYHVSWTSTPIRRNQDVTFTVRAADLSTGDPLQSLPGEQDLPLSRVEVYQPCEPTRLGPAQNFKAEFSKISTGVYEGGPIRFDQPGRWVVRFHFFEQCNDGERSPHGHVAFFVDVP